MSRLSSKYFHPYERINNEDLMEAFAYPSKDISNILKYLLARSPSIDGAPRNCVLDDSFSLTYVNSTTATLSAGMGFYYDAGSETDTESDYKVYGLDADLDITAFVTEGTMYLIQAKPLYTGSNENTLIADTAGKTWTEESRVKVYKPAMDTSVGVMIKSSAGTSFPSTDAGCVPLWYVYVPVGGLLADGSCFFDARKFVTMQPLADTSFKICGFQLAWVDADTIRFHDGHALMNSQLLVEDGDLDLDLADILDADESAGGVVADSVYYLYLACPDIRGDGDLTGGRGYIIASKDKYPLWHAAGVSDDLTIHLEPAISTAIQTTTSRGLYLGSVLTDSTGDIIEFIKDGNRVTLLTQTDVLPFTEVAEGATQAVTFPTSIANSVFQSLIVDLHTEDYGSTSVGTELVTILRRSTDPDGTYFLRGAGYQTPSSTNAPGWTWGICPNESLVVKSIVNNCYIEIGLLGYYDKV